MARPWRIRFAGARYHVTVRGNARQVVFHGDEYYARFLEQLADAMAKDEVILYAFVLMPNHYHLFVETPLGNIQRFMQRLNTSYSMYHRYKHQSPGHCFQGRYGAKLVKGDQYVLALTRYIHLNPVKVAGFESEGIERKLAYLNGYRWSSYGQYVGLGGCEGLKVDERWLKLMHGVTAARNRAGYRKYVERFVSRTDEEFKGAQRVSRYAVGEERFIEQVESDLRVVQENKGVYGDIKWPEGRKLELAEIAAAVAKKFRIAPEMLHTRTVDGRMARKVALELSCKYSGQSQRKVGEYYGYKGNGSVLKQRQRLKELLAADSGLRQKMTALTRTLGRA